MPLLLRWLLAALAVDMAVSVILTIVCLVTGWSPVDPLFAVVDLIR